VRSEQKNGKKEREHQITERKEEAHQFCKVSTSDFEEFSSCSVHHLFKLRNERGGLGTGSHFPLHCGEIWHINCMPVYKRKAEQRRDALLPETSEEAARPFFTPDVNTEQAADNDIRNSFT
jgi:hypothetical protein